MMSVADDGYVSSLGERLNGILGLSLNAGKSWLSRVVLRLRRSLSPSALKICLFSRKCISVLLDRRWRRRCRAKKRGTDGIYSLSLLLLSDEEPSFSATMRFGPVSISPPPHVVRDNCEIALTPRRMELFVCPPKHASSQNQRFLLKAGVLKQRLSYPSETLLYTMINRNKIVLFIF